MILLLSYFLFFPCTAHCTRQPTWREKKMTARKWELAWQWQWQWTWTSTSCGRMENAVFVLSKSPITNVLNVSSLSKILADSFISNTWPLFFSLSLAAPWPATKHIKVVVKQRSIECHVSYTSLYSHSYAGHSVMAGMARHGMFRECLWCPAQSKAHGPIACSWLATDHRATPGPERIHRYVRMNALTLLMLIRVAPHCRN